MAQSGCLCFTKQAVIEAAKDEKFQDLKKVFEEIRKQLEENYEKLKEDQKSWQKFVKRLLFKWHPDKNPNNVSEATEVTKFIQNEAERIEAGRQINSGSSWSNDWSDLFRRWHKEASSQRDQRREWKDNYRRYNPRYNSRDRSTGPGFSFNVPPSFQKSDLPAARRWLAEAEEDLKAARKNFSAGFYNYAAYAARMVSLVELGFNF